MAQDASSSSDGGDFSQSQTATSSNPSLSRNLSSSRLNAKAAEFVPRSSSSGGLSDPTQQPTPFLYHQAPAATGFFQAQGQVRVPVQNHRQFSHLVPVQYQQKQQQQHQHQHQKKRGVDSDHVQNNGLTEDAAQKILNQVEYYFSDVNLATTDHLMRFINKDPDGYVPISVVSSFKKIKAVISSDSQLAGILRNSAKLVVSEDGKKVRRLFPLTELEMEELQARIVIAENLPEDHCHQNLMKIFSAIGSVKSIRTCPPQTPNGGASSGSRTAKADGAHFSNKLHAFVEYGSVELAEQAVAELNEEGTWRNGLKVRLLHKHSAKSAKVRSKKVGRDGEANFKEDETSNMEQQDPDEKHLEEPSQPYEDQSLQGDEHLSEKEGTQKKGRSRGRGKGRGRLQYHHNNNHNYRGNHVGTTPSVHPVSSEHPTVTKQPPGPRMPDGTRGFSMGRGKPVAVNIV